MRRGRTIHAFAADLEAAQALASGAGFSCHPIEVHRFPDGESLVRVEPSEPGAVIYCRLGHPNAKLVELLLAADALADSAGEQPTLVAPYLPYMRQDKAFHAGEAVSQRTIGRLLAGAFASVITVEPHLHRTAALDGIMPGTRAVALSAASALAALVEDAGRAPLLVGPDIEASALVAAVAEVSRCEWLHLDKVREGDRAVVVEQLSQRSVRGRAVVLLDDICSTGATLIAAAELLRDAGAASIEALVVHALFDDGTYAAMRAGGIERVRSSDALPHSTNAASLTTLLASALRGGSA